MIPSKNEKGTRVRFVSVFQPGCERQNGFEPKSKCKQLLILQKKKCDENYNI